MYEWQRLDGFGVLLGLDLNLKNFCMHYIAAVCELRANLGVTKQAEGELYFDQLMF